MTNVTRTINLQTAAYVIAKGYNMPRIEGSQGQLEFFFDDDSGEISKRIEFYLSSKEVPERNYYRALQDLRTTMNRTTAMKRSGGVR